MRAAAPPWFLDLARTWVPGSCMHGRSSSASSRGCPACLAQVAINDEVLVAVSNQHLAHKGGMLDLWMRNVRARGMAHRRPQPWNPKT